MAKKVDPIKEKEKRQRMIAIVGGVLLLGLLAFQVPRTMKTLKGPSAESSTSSSQSSSSAPGSTPLAPPTLEGGATSGSTAGSGSSVETSDDGVRDPTAPLPASAGQLVSFSRFKSKDPFNQQVSDCASDGCIPAGAPPPKAPAPKAPVSVPASTPPPAPPPSRPTPTFTPPASTTAAAVTTALISVNGTTESVSVGKTFPAADPVFVLASLKRTEARVSIAGGSLENGAATVRLRLGKAVTLQNTADGTQYVLKLVRVS